VLLGLRRSLRRQRGTIQTLGQGRLETAQLLAQRRGDFPAPGLDLSDRLRHRGAVGLLFRRVHRLGARRLRVCGFRPGSLAHHHVVVHRLGLHYLGHVPGGLAIDDPGLVTEAHLGLLLGEQFEFQRERTDGHLVPAVDKTTFHRLAVDERPVGTAQVLDDQALGGDVHLGVRSGDDVVVELEIDLGTPADRERVLGKTLGTPEAALAEDEHLEDDMLLPTLRSLTHRQPLGARCPLRAARRDSLTSRETPCE
jgi:hypothetical protein